jgi:branched-chain amino acid transport system permease protein
LRLASFSLAIVTFAFGDMLFHVVKGFNFTGGPQGIFMPPLAAAGWLGGRFLYYLVGLLFGVAMLVSHSLSTSKSGRALRVVGASEIVAQSLGINLLRYKTLAFTASAVYGACAGCLMALVTAYVAPDTYSPDLSISVFAAVMIGGVGTLMGPVWGALFVVLIPELTQSVNGLSLIVYAVLFTVVVTVYPGGIVAAWEALIRRRIKRQPIGQPPITHRPRESGDD